MRPFRFAIMATTAPDAAVWRAKARRVEELGYDVLLMPDHLGPQLAPTPALMAAADATMRLRIGSFVFANDYRNPVMLAKEAATLDVLSAGRLEFGLGAGWNTRDYEQLGIAYDPPAVRVARMAEAIRLIRRLWTEEAVEHSGAHYTVRGVKLLPKPVQSPCPPIMIGGGGPTMLRLAARHADIVALAPQVNAEGGPHLAHLAAGATADKIATVRAAAGERFASLELNVIVFDAAVTGDRSSFAASVAARLKGAAAGVIDSPYFLFGSLDQIRADLLARRERFGISYVALPEKVMEAFAPLAQELGGR